jgi:hypothetical protein
VPHPRRVFVFAARVGFHPNILNGYGFFVGFLMPDESKQITRIDLQPEEIIRIVAWRFRISRYIFVVSAVWIVVAAAIYFFWLGFDYQNTNLHLVSFVMQMIGCAIIFVAFAVQLATYRCPVCDKFLGRVHKNKPNCPGCNAEVK